MVKQSYSIIPEAIKGGGDGVYEPEILIGGGFPAAEGWYATIPRRICWMIRNAPIG